MIAKFDLRALRNVRPYYRNEADAKEEPKEEPKQDTPKEESSSDDHELNRYVLSKLICKLLNDYSEGPDFIQEHHNFSSLKGLSKDDWDDFIDKLISALDKSFNVAISKDTIKVDYEWATEDGREIKEFIDKIWDLVGKHSSEAYDYFDEKEDDDKEKKDEEPKSKSKEDDGSGEDSDTPEGSGKAKSDDDEDEEDDDDEKSKSDKSDDEDDDKEKEGSDEVEKEEEEKQGKEEKAEEILKVCLAKYPTAIWDSAAFEPEMRRLEMYRRYVRSLNVTSSEGLGTGLLKIFIGVTDVFLKVGNTFKTNLFKFYKDLKRSEIRYYYESHTTMCLKAESVPITQVTDIQVPVPNGLKGTCQMGCMSLQQTYDMLDLQAYGEGVRAALVDFRRKLMRSEEYKSVLIPMNNLVKQRDTMLKQLKASSDKVFIDKQTPMEVKFMEAYKSMKEFKDTRVSLLDMEKYLAATNKMVHMIDDIDTVLADITSYMTEDQEVDKSLVMDLINIVKYMGVSFDIYGTTTTRQMAMEHNHIGAIGRVWATVK